MISSQKQMHISLTNHVPGDENYFVPILAEQQHFGLVPLYSRGS